jgi:hypothetical protein
VVLSCRLVGIRFCQRQVITPSYRTCLLTIFNINWTKWSRNIKIQW